MARARCEPRSNELSSDRASLPLSEPSGTLALPHRRLDAIAFRRDFERCRPGSRVDRFGRLLLGCGEPRSAAPS